MLSTLSTLTKQAMGQVRQRTSTEQRSMTWWCAVCATCGEKSEERQQFGQSLAPTASRRGIAATPPVHGNDEAREIPEPRLSPPVLISACRPVLAQPRSQLRLLL